MAGLLILLQNGSARKDALRIIREVLEDDAERGVSNLDRSIVIYDDAGVPLQQVPFHEAIK
jgi:hypothetical protein